MMQIVLPIDQHVPRQKLPQAVWFHRGLVHDPRDAEPIADAPARSFVSVTEHKPLSKQVHPSGQHKEVKACALQGRWLLAKSPPG